MSLIFLTLLWNPYWGQKMRLIFLQKNEFGWGRRRCSFTNECRTYGNLTVFQMMHNFAPFQLLE